MGNGLSFKEWLGLVGIINLIFMGMGQRKFYIWAAQIGGQTVEKIINSYYFIWAVLIVLFVVSCIAYLIMRVIIYWKYRPY